MKNCPKYWFFHFCYYTFLIRLALPDNMHITFMKTYDIAILISCWFVSTMVSAEIVTDGTLGNAMKLNGSEYQITPELGKQVGSNLFHSFQQFNLDEGETAIFSGSDMIQNIISRITDQNPSYIDGTIRATVPHANLYFINPSGILFGEHAKLDLSGSFYASSADVLHFTDGGEFHARTPTLSYFTTAAVKDFGFLTENPAPLLLNGSQLHVPTRQHLALIGGNLTLQHAKIQAEQGQIGLASVASQATVTLGATDSIQGKITLTEGSELNTSGEGGGKIWIRGGQLIVNDATLQTDTLGKYAGQGIDISTTERIEITGDRVALSSTTSDAGDAGFISITTPELHLHGSVIDGSSLGAGMSGNIHINTQRTQLTQGAVVMSETFTDGRGGSIEIIADQSLNIFGKRAGTLDTAGRSLGLDNPSWISTVTFGDNDAGDIVIHAGDINLTTGMISSISLGVGRGGNLSVYGKSLQLRDGGLIDCLGMTYGGAGSIMTHIDGDIDISGYYPGVIVLPGIKVPDTESGINSVTFGMENSGNIDISARKLSIEAATITASTLSDGDAGLLTVNVESIYLSQGGQINSTSGLVLGGVVVVGNGNGGSVRINATKEVVLHDRNKNGGFRSGIFTSTRSPQGRAGNIELNTPHLSIYNDAAIATRAAGIGDAGYIHIRSDDILLSNQGRISAESQNSTGGTITLDVSHLLYLNQSDITTSVKTGGGNGGNIEITIPLFTVLNYSTIKAQAEQGQGGNIRITASNFLKSSESLINASSRLGIHGNVLIKAPSETLSNSLLTLNNKFLDASNMFPQSCRAKTEGQRPSEFVRPFTFKVNLFKHFPNSTEDLFASRACRL
jgi:filamentous hemagglutinin family protein